MQAPNRLKQFDKLKPEPGQRNPTRPTTLGHCQDSTGAIQYSLKGWQLCNTTRPSAQ